MGRRRAIREIRSQAFQRARHRIQPHQVAVAQPRQGSPIRRLGRDVDRRRHLARGARHAPVRHQRHPQVLHDGHDAVVAVLEPIVHCNRAQVENGRTYLREMAFGDATEPHHAQALAIVARTEEAVAGIVERLTSATPSDAAALAHVVSAVMMLAMSSAVDESVPDDEIVAGVRRQLEVVLPR